jgi:hypothetical protein
MKGKPIHWHIVLLLSLTLMLAGVFVPVAAQPLPTAITTPSFDFPQNATHPSVPAQAVGALAVTTQADDHGITVTWPGTTAVAAAAIEQLPTVRYQGYLLPMQVFTVALPATQQAVASASVNALVAIDRLAATPWSGALQPAAPLTPPLIADEQTPSAPLTPEVVALPTAPLFLLRQGNLHGQPIAVFAFSPIYQDGGTVNFVTDFAATIAGATSLSSLLSVVDAAHDAVAAASAQQPAAAFPPTNPDAARTAIKLHVAAVGMQEVTGAQLAAAGLNLTAVNPALLQLKQAGSIVALEIEGLSGGRLTSTSRIRFYAPTVGNRWNTGSIYWLTVGDAPGVRMASRAVTPGSATARDSALEIGYWSAPKLYDSRYAGADGDYWYHQKLIANTDSNAPLEAVTIATATQLPRIAGTATYTLSVTTNIRGQHTVRASAGNVMQEITWNSVVSGTFAQDWQRPFTLATSSDALQIALLEVIPSTVQSDPATLLDKLSWQQPVELAFGQQGAAFSGVAGTWRYSWRDLPSGFGLYDVTNPLTPVRLTGATAAAFQDGPAARHYLVTGPGTVATPVATAHTPVVWNTSGADAIYITPAAFADALQPLLALRQSQGYKVAVVDLQDIYDGWSFGAVSPTAIRAFLRHAHSTWTPVPYSVVLVGDGTWDPHDYEGRGNQNWIPPYLAKVDPWLGEAACENCYVQLDGDDPLTGDDPQGNFFAIDMWVGRLPVKSAGELVDLANKLITYETMNGTRLWQNRVVYIADNYIREITTDGNLIVDLAGDFAKHADNIAQLAPASVVNERIYYDPYPQKTDPSGQEPWRIPSAATAFNMVLRSLSGGAGVVVYNGHSHQWQWAVTDEGPAANPDYLLGLYDADALTNKDSYFINLSMTCLTSQFPKPALSGTVLDERLILNPTGGAIAVWGPAGLSVAYGHDFLQRGFFEKLWGAAAGSARLGELIEAGYTKLLTEDTCCHDTAKTFLLLGDPLTKAQATADPVHGLYLPTIKR